MSERVAGGHCFAGVAFRHYNLTTAGVTASRGAFLEHPVLRVAWNAVKCRDLGETARGRSRWAPWHGQSSFARNADLALVETVFGNTFVRIKYP